MQIEAFDIQVFLKWSYAPLPTDANSKLNTRKASWKIAGFNAFFGEVFYRCLTVIGIKTL